jgi:hypothetical protein
MGAARRDPRRGENPVELAAASRLMTSLEKAGVSRTNRLALNNIGQTAERVLETEILFISRQP